MFGNFRHERNVLQRGEAGDQVVELEDEADVLAAEARELALPDPREIVVEEAHLALGRAAIDAVPLARRSRLMVPAIDQ